MVRVSLPKIDKKQKKELEILHTGQRKGGTYFFRFYPLIRDYVSLISTSIIFILFSQFLELLHPRSSKWSHTYAMRPAFVNFRKEHTVFGFLFLVHMTVFAYFLQLYIPFSSMSWLEPTSFYYFMKWNHTSCNQLSGALGWNMRILQQECRLENKDVSRERKQEGNLPAQPTHPPTRG